MAIKFKVDLTNDTPEKVEGGDKPPIGWYMAKLEDVFQDEKDQGVEVHQFVLLEPARGYEGKKLFNRIYDPEMSENEEQASNAADLVKRLAKRMGLLADGDYGRQTDKDFGDCIGNTYLLKVTSATEKTIDSKGKEKYVPTDKFPPKIDKFSGVYPLDYPKDKLPKDFPNDLRPFLTGPEKTDPKTMESRAAVGAGANGAAAPKRAERDMKKLL